MKAVRSRSAGMRGLLLAPGVFLACTTAFAAEGALVLEEIIVTAQKREQRLEEVPVSIAVFTRADIVASNMETVEDYADRAPGFYAEHGEDERSYEITIRGIGQLGGDANNFGLYLDEFELTGTASGNVGAELADIERIEVLRGPQGTAFGRNVIAGAVNLTSIKPQSDEFAGTVEIEGTSFGGRNARASVNVPLAEGVAAMRLTGAYRSSDGYLRNTGSSGQSNDFENTSWRAAFRLTPSDSLTIDLAASTQKYEQGLPNNVTDGELIGTMAFLQEVIDAGLGALPPGTLPAGPTPFPAQNRFIETNTITRSEFDTDLLTLRGVYELESFSVTSVSGYVYNKSNSVADFDASDFDLFIGTTPYSKGQFWSSELRANSTGNGAFGWIVGAYYSEGKERSDSTTLFGSDAELVSFISDGEGGGGSLLPNNEVLFAGRTIGDQRGKAVFAEVDYDFTPKLTAQVGARYNEDSVHSISRDGVDFTAGGDLPDDEQRATFSKTTWRTSLVYKPLEGLNFYGTVATGYRAGGLQLRTLTRPSFGPEEAMNYEVGMKALLFDERLSVNIAGFFIDWQDVQVTAFDFSNGAQFTDNVGKAEVQGVELDFRALLATGFEISGGVGYLDTEIVDYETPDGSFNGSRLPNAPDVTANLTADYEFPLTAQLKGFARASALHIGDRLESVFDPTIKDIMPAYTRYDLHLGVRGDGWTVSAFGENLTDKRYRAGVLLSGFSLSGAGVTSPPRLYGVRATVDF